MLKTLPSVVALTLVFAGASMDRASAAPIDLGTFTGTYLSNSAGFSTVKTSGLFSDVYSFQTLQDSIISASVTSAYSIDPLISNFTLSLYKGTAGSGTFISDVVASNYTIGTAKFEYGGLSSTQAGGPFYITVSGDASGSPSYAGSLNISVSPVPLPAGLPMFAAAITALGVAGYAMNVRKKNAASVAI